MSGRANPFVGPRAFATGEPLYGRDRERAALLDLLIAERIVLLHAPSGAGKSSLIQAGLVPDLIAEGFVVRPVIRVGMEPPPGAPPGANRHLLSALLSLEQGQPRTMGALARMDLAATLDRDAADAEVLVFDQFEEILTVDPNNREGKHAFFTAVGAALRSTRRYALFSMREDHVASLAPYVRALPTRLKVTFQLELLGAAAAMQAAQMPAQAAGVAFTEAAARRMIDDLRQVKVQAADGSTTVELGPFVEPVQLQVACRNLWARLPEDDRTIEPADVAAMGDVDAALTEYYETQVAAVAAASGTPEREIRSWCGRALISEQGLRGQVLQASEASAGLANAVIGRLIDAHLVRAEKRRGATWFELAHDRMIAPVRASNTRWTEAHLSPIQRQAELWDKAGRPESLLLRERGPAERAVRDAGSPAEQAFAEQSLRMILREEETTRLRSQSLWTRRALMWSALLALAGTVFVLVSRYQHEIREAGRSSRLRFRAEVAAGVAEWQRQRASAAADAALGRRLAAELSLLPGERVDLAALLAVAATKVTTGFDAKAGLYSLQARAPRLLAAFQAPVEPRRLAGSADETRLAALGLDELWQWDVGSRRVTGKTTTRAVRWTDLAFDERRRQFALVDTLGAVRWYSEDGAEAKRIGGRDDRGVPHALAIAGDGSVVATADEAGEVAVLDAETGARLAGVKLAEIRVDGVDVLRFAPDGRTLAISTRDGVALWSWAERGAVQRTPGSFASAGSALGPVTMAFTADGSAIVGAHADGRILRWSTAGGRIGPAIPLARLANEPPNFQYASVDATGRRHAFLGLGLAGDGSSAAALVCTEACSRVSLRVWDAATGVAADTAIELYERPSGVWRFPVLVRDGAALVGGVTHAVRVLDTRSWRPFAAPEGAWVAAGAFSGDGRHVAVVSRFTESAGSAAAGELAVVDPLARTRVFAAATEGEVRDVAFFAGDTRVGLLTAGGGLRTFDAASGAAVAATRTMPGAARLFARGDGLLAASVAPLRIVDALTGAEVHAAAPRGEMTVLAADAGATRIAAGGCEARTGDRCDRGVVHVWTTGDETPRSAEEPGGAVTFLQFAPDGRRLLRATADGTIRVWDLVDGTTVDLSLDDEPVAAAAWSPDGEMLATLGCVAAGCARTGESVLRLFMAANLTPITPPQRSHSPLLAAPRASARLARFSHDCGALITVSRDGVVATAYGLEGMLTAACRLAGREMTAGEWARHVVPARPQVPVCPQAK